MKNIYHIQTINDVPSGLTRTSLMSIDLYNRGHLSQYHENLYALFAHFYRNHQLPFGQKENFVANFSLNSLKNPTEILMDVGFRFTALFSDD